MKKLFILLLFISSTFSLAQWNTESSLFNVSNGTKVSSFVDQNGTHIVYYYNGAVKYAYVNGSGTLVRYNVTIESSNSDLANIVSDGSNLFAIYNKNNYLTVNKSTNLGANWNVLSPNYQFKNTGCNEIKSKIDGEYIHITWAELRSGSYNDYDVHYVRFYYPNPAWAHYQRVTDVESGGDLPAIELSSTKIHVSYRTYDYQTIHVRTKDISTGTWNSPENIPVYQSFLDELDERSISTNVKFNDILISNDRINSIFKIDWSGLQSSGSYVAQSYKLNSGGSWQIEDGFNSENDYPYPYNVVSAKTSALLHVIYWDKDNSHYTHRSINGSSWSSSIANVSLNTSNSLSSNGNDLYLVKSEYFAQTYIKYRKYDQAPLTPANIAGSTHDIGWNAYPKVTWTAVNEPDVRANTTNGIIIERSLNLGAFSVVANLSGQVTSFIDYGVPYAGSGPSTARYRIKARDINAHESGWTSIVSIAYGDAWKTGAGEEVVTVKPDQFHLSSNYPNPFNPSTKINYAVSEDAMVKIKIYDMLGTEVITLVDENKPAGYYIADFDASNLSSGIYVYRITALKGDKILFNQSKQMILMK